MNPFRIPLCLALAFAGGASFASETVEVSLPIGVVFYVTDVASSTTGSLDPSRVGFSGASLDPGRTLGISVQAEAANFTPPSGNPIPASKVSWTVSNASGGSGSGGTLSSTAYTLLFQGASGASSGGVDVTWTLAAPGGGIRAGSHGLVIRWKLESM